MSPEGGPPELGSLVSIKGAGKRRASCAGSAAGVGKSAEQRRTQQAPGSCTGNPYLPLPGCPGGQGATPGPSWHCRALAGPSPGKGQLLTWQVVPEVGGGDSQPPDPHHPPNSEHAPLGLPRITERAKGADPAPSEGKSGCPLQTPGASGVRLPGGHPGVSPGAPRAGSRSARSWEQFYFWAACAVRGFFLFSLRSQQSPFGKFQAGSAVLRTGDI